MSKFTEQQLSEALSSLNGGLNKKQRSRSLWKVQNNRLQKTFMFNDFKQAFAFMSEMALYAEEINHHPEWKNIYNRVDIALTTHDQNGISKLDFDFAERIEIVSARYKSNL